MPCGVGMEAPRQEAFLPGEEMSSSCDGQGPYTPACCVGMNSDTLHTWEDSQVRVYSMQLDGKCKPAFVLRCTAYFFSSFR